MNRIIIANKPKKYLKKYTLSSGRLNIRAIAQNGADLQIDGLIKIPSSAKNTESFLDIRVLLLDDKSHADVRPQLEIESNEVKASHAASISPIDPEQLFYLQSRGLDEESAKKLIVTGFLSHA